MTPDFGKLDRGLLVAVIVSILTVVGVNFTTSYGHIYLEGLAYGEYGVDARLTPIGIDAFLLALGLVNVFAARFERSHWLLRVALGFGVAGTVAANAAYGANWGMTGGLLATWSPVALFIVVEAGLYAFRIVAERKAAQDKAQKAAETPKRGRPVGSKNSTPRKKAPVEPQKGVYDGPDVTAIVPPVTDPVDVLNPFHNLPQAS